MPATPRTTSSRCLHPQGTGSTGYASREKKPGGAPASASAPSLRLPAAWDRVARHLSSEGAPYPNGGKPGAAVGRCLAHGGRARRASRPVRPPARPHAATRARTSSWP
jgi:hypothetical protein